MRKGGKGSQSETVKTSSSFLSRRHRWKCVWHRGPWASLNKNTTYGLWMCWLEQAQHQQTEQLCWSSPQQHDMQRQLIRPTVSEYQSNCLQEMSPGCKTGFTLWLLPESHFHVAFTLNSKGTKLCLVAHKRNIHRDRFNGVAMVISLSNCGY